MKIKPCKQYDRLTKNSFLALLPTYIDPNYVIDLKTGNKVLINTIKVNGGYLALKNGYYKKRYLPIEQSYPKKLFYKIEDDDWEIISFNPSKKEVCFKIKERTYSWTFSNV